MATSAKIAKSRERAEANKLAFEQIMEYMKHGHGKPGDRPDQ